MNLGFPEMIFLFFLALIIFGPKKMPEIGRQIGKAMNEFKKASNEFKAQIESEINQIDVENRYQSSSNDIHRIDNPNQILPPAEPPEGTLAKGSVEPEQAPTIHATVNTQDA